MLTRLCLIRHGETDWNAARRLQGHTDIPLNATGLHQAAAVAASLGDESFSALYSSDLQRAAQTAHAISQRLKLEVLYDKCLRERNFGELQGLTPEESQQRYPELQPLMRARDAEFVPPHGESLGHFAQQVEACIHDIAARHQGETVLIVAHGGVLDVAYRLATGKPLSSPRDFALGNATLNWLGLDCTAEEKKWLLLAWDERTHLQASRDELPLV